MSTSMLDRFCKIKDSFKGKLEKLQDKFFYEKKELNFIENKFPNFIDDELDKLTNKMSNFYDDVKFPNYDDCENYASLYDKGINNIFTKRIDEEIGYGKNILELGCGTGQLSLFLSRANRKIFGVDISNGSLKLGENFRSKNDIDNVFFMKMDVFDLKFKKNYFDFVISNGVLHHTKDAEKAFKNLVEVTKPGGIIVIGLYHKYGRFFTKVKQKLARLLGENIFILDKTSLNIKSKDKRKAWVIDQFLNPHETLHTPKEVLRWFELNKIDFLNLMPHCDDIREPLFKRRPIPKLSFLNEILFSFNRRQIQEGGFFVIIGQKRN